MTTFDPKKIEDKLDHAVIASVEVEDGSGLNITQMAQVMEFAKLMALSGPAVPAYMRNNPGACLAICTRAVRWRFDPFFVAEKSYLAKLKGGEERIAFESQLIHAVIEARAPLKGRLRHEIVGEGDNMRCRVWGTFRGETDPHIYEGPTLRERLDAIGRNEYGKIKGSPLWESKPKVQLFYDACRDWCREFAPEVLGGVYTLDELPDAEPVDVTPAPSKARSTLVERLQGAKRDAASRGFDPSHVSREAANAQGSNEVKPANDGEENGEEKDPGPVTSGGDDAAAGRDVGQHGGSGDADDRGAGDGDGEPADRTGEQHASGGDAEAAPKEARGTRKRK